MILYWSCLFFLNNHNILYKNDCNVNEQNQKIQISSDGPDYWPTTGWITSSPESQGINSQRLQAMDNYIQSSSLRLSIDSLLIIKNGYLIYEAYPSQVFDANDRHHLFSVTKSFTSTLIGIAIDKGYIGGIDDLILDFFPNRTIDNMDPRKQNIRIEHLLTMTTGFEWLDDENFNPMWASSDSVQYILERPMIYSPGSRWNYNTGASHLLSAILNKVTPNGTLGFAEDFLFTPLGITDYTWSVDFQGNPNGGTLLFLRPRDMAKLGYLYLMEGRWENQQLISRTWTNQATSPSVVFPPYMLSYTGYGYQWWDIFWGKGYAARGSNQQNIFIFPDIDLIVITTGFTDFDPISLLLTYIFPAANYVVLHPFIHLIIIINALGLVFFIPFFVNDRGLKKKLGIHKKDVKFHIKEISSNKEF
ncbi:MAG: serine hydrolase domain-containing protein [Candidatus Thorarchaeota archaeon]